MSRFILFCLSLIFSFSAVSAETCFEFQASYSERTTGWYSTKEKACAALNGSYAVGGTAVSRTVSNSKPNDFGGCNLDVTTTHNNGAVINGGGSGPLNSRQTDQCTRPSECTAKAGTISTMNYTRGWARSSVSNKSDQIGATAELPNSICNDGCKYSVLGNEVAYRSAEPSAQGLYRLSSDVAVIQTDQTCSAAEQTAAVKPSSPDAPCPGSLGELNGKPYCAMPAGTTGVQPVGPPSKEPDDKGNPAAGPKPSSGEGSGTGGVGRTPTTGTGGNAGGPASAANGGTGTKPGGTSPDGTRDKPQDGKEQAACGAPGQPQCKIDETGTPDGKGVLDKYGRELADADKSRTDLLSTIKDKSDKDTTWGVSFGWVQHGGCQPWVLGTLPVGPGIEMKIDICPILPYIEWVTSFLWAITTFALTIAMVFRVTTQSGS